MPPTVAIPVVRLDVAREGLHCPGGRSSPRRTERSPAIPASSRRWVAARPRPETSPWPGAAARRESAGGGAPPPPPPSIPSGFSVSRRATSRERSSSSSLAGALLRELGQGDERGRLGAPAPGRSPARPPRRARATTPRPPSGRRTVDAAALGRLGREDACELLSPDASAAAAAAIRSRAFARVTRGK